MSAMRVGILDEDIPDHRISLASLSEPSSRNSKFDPTMPVVFLKKMEEIVRVGHLAGDDLFFPLIIGNGERNLHRLIRRVLLCKVDEFYVEG
jgi:hypothetical protein